MFYRYRPDCFIDGDHSFEGALADIRNFLPKLKPGGWLVIQDCIGDVLRAVEAANLRGAGMHMMLVPPPYGHHVLMCHRDKATLAQYEDLLRQAISAAKPVDWTGLDWTGLDSYRWAAR